MKQLFIFLFSFAFVTAQAQDSTFKEYVGKYIFPEGSPVTETEVALTNNILTAISTHGTTTLEKRGRDTFYITSYDGMAYFKRNEGGKVAGIKIEVGDMVLEGKKENTTAFINRHTYYFTKQKIAAK